MTDDGQHLPFARDLRDAVACYARKRWPRDAAKQAARTWGLSLSTAANVLKGHASDTTITRILKAGGWRLGLALLEALIDQSLSDFIQSELKEAARDRDRRTARADRLAQAEAARRHALVRLGRRLPADRSHTAL